MNIILFSICFFFVFGWKCSPNADIILVLSIALSAYAFFRRPTFTVFHLFYAGILSLIVIYSGIITLLNNVSDLQVLLRALRALINFGGAFSLIELYYENNKKTYRDVAVNHLTSVIFLHGIIIIIMYMFPFARTAVYSVTDAATYVNLHTPFLTGLRITGLTYGLSSTSVLQLSGLITLFCGFMFGNNVRGPHFLPIVVMQSFVLMVSIFLTGRLGLIIFSLFLPIFIVCLLRTNQSSLFNFRKKNIYISMLFFFLFFLLGVVFLTLMPIAFWEYTLIQAQEIFHILPGTKESVTLSLLNEMIFLPAKFSVFMVGDGSLEPKVLGFGSDIGFVKILFALGISGTILYLSVIILNFVIAWIVKRVDLSLALILVLLSISSIILHCKELGLLTRGHWSVQSLMICLALKVLSDAVNEKDGDIPVGRSD